MELFNRTASAAPGMLIVVFTSLSNAQTMSLMARRLQRKLLIAAHLLCLRMQLAKLLLLLVCEVKLLAL